MESIYSYITRKLREGQEIFQRGTIEELINEFVHLREENALIRAQLNEVLLWHPFSEERPPYDESRYAVRSIGDKKYWCWLPPMPEAK